MALPDYLRVQSGTTKTWRASGGDAAMSPSSTLTNGLSWGSVKVDLGATRAEFYDVFLDMEFQTAPTAGNTVDVFWAPSTSITAGTDNPGGFAGTDALYAGYSSNADASNPQLQFIGSHVCTTQATGTVQKSYVGRFSPAQRYGGPMIRNGSGVTAATTNTTFQIRLVPVEGVIEE